MSYAHGLRDDTDALVTASLHHWKAEAGLSYTSSHAHIDLADNGTDLFVWVSGTTNTKHTSFGVAAGGDALVRGYQSPVMEDMGTAMASFNRKIGCGSTTDVVTYYTGSSGDLGTMLFDAVVGGGEKSFAGGGGYSAGEGWIVPASVGTFALEVINKGGAAKSISVEFNWYEEA